MLENGLAYQFLFCITLWKALIPGSSAVEQATVNRLAGGSNPSRGATLLSFKPPRLHDFIRGLKLNTGEPQAQLTEQG